MAKILFIGDIVGKPGRKALAQVLPVWKQEYNPDAIIANTENVAHGKGVTPSTLREVADLGVDCFTGGNHSFDKQEQAAESFEKFPNLLRPANLPAEFSGHGFYRFAKNGRQYLVVNIHGTVFCEQFFEGKLKNPFLEIDRILSMEAQKGDIILVDFHAEATSEKKTMGFFLDGRVTGVLGTHTHVPTADAHVMAKGTAYISDLGMTGTRDSALGVKFENALVKFLDPSAKFKNEVEEEGIMQVNGALIEADEHGKAINIKKLYGEIPGSQL